MCIVVVSTPFLRLLWWCHEKCLASIRAPNPLLFFHLLCSADLPAVAARSRVSLSAPDRHVRPRTGRGVGKRSRQDQEVHRRRLRSEVGAVVAAGAAGVADAGRCQRWCWLQCRRCGSMVVDV